MQAPPPITRALLIACTVLLFAAQIPSLALLMGQWLALHPVLSGFWPWQLVTFPFVMMLSYFGTELEGIWGERRFIQFVLASVLVAAAVYLLLSLLPPLLGWAMPTSVMFDSSCISMGLLVAVGILFPQRPIRVYFVIEVTQRVAAWVGIGILVFIALGRFANGSGAWAPSLGVLGGALGGYLMLLYWRWRPPSFRRKKPPAHIRRVH
jgi:membrane associated rhomboid family serine protease